MEKDIKNEEKIDKKKILVVLGAGGHTNQMLKLVDLLGDKYEYDYIIANDDNLSENKIRIQGKIFRIINPRKMEDKSFIKVFLEYIPSSIQAIFYLLKSNAKFILACGPASSVHICLLGKLLGKKIIFLESWSRVNTKSMSGRFVHPFADLFFIQWLEQKKNYKKAIYAGRLG